MGVRNCKELGPGLQRIIRRLLANQNLCKLLYPKDIMSLLVGAYIRQISLNSTGTPNKNLSSIIISQIILNCITSHIIS